jgi:CheY-like chemotaxis protein
MTASVDSENREGGALTILLVEDHADTRKLLQRVLGGLGHRTVAVASCADARAVDNMPINLVLSDLGLPDGDGIELLRELKQRFGCRVAALTGYGDAVDLDRTRAAGVDWHLTKPITMQDLKGLLISAGERTGG